MPLEKMLFGTMTLGKRWQNFINAQSALSEIYIEPTVLPDEALVRAIESLAVNQMLKKENTIIAARIAGRSVDFSDPEDCLEQLTGLEVVNFDGSLDIIESLQYLIENNAARIISDWKIVRDSGWGERSASYKNLIAGPKTELRNVFIDDRQGPVIIGDGVTLLPGVSILGPVVIQSGAVVKMGAELYSGTVIGARSVVSGEIKNSIIHVYSAKGHDGYLGDSILGRWNNIGAGTTVSNVSNTFSKVRITDWNTGEKTEYDSIKRGIVTGDFVRLGIQSRVFRGTAIGSFTSISTGAPIQGNIPEFTWWAEDRQSRYEPEALREHCRRQMNLHDQDWNGDWEKALRSLISGPSTGSRSPNV